MVHGRGWILAPSTPAERRKEGEGKLVQLALGGNSLPVYTAVGTTAACH
jgi:hypothetical protein